MSNDTLDWDFYPVGDEIPPGNELCPKCSGQRIVSCHCGGDLCVCDNQGERDCPLCYGEGDVKKERAQKYLSHEREMHAAFQKAWTDSETKGKRVKPA